jgi:hypothetical protein
MPIWDTLKLTNTFDSNFLFFATDQNEINKNNFYFSITIVP